MNYYQQLYSSKNVHAEEMKTYFKSLDSVNIQKLNNFESNSCEGDITAIECDRVLTKFKKKKITRLRWLAYRILYTILAFVKGSLDNEKLSDSQGILTLLHKKRDPQLLQNYRPISLLNTVYNIVMHIYANRMHKVLHIIISEDQNGYAKKRFIGYNIGYNRRHHNYIT